MKSTPWERRLRAARRAILLEIGDRHRWNQLAMAAEMGVHRNTVARNLSDAGIDPQARWALQLARAKRLCITLGKYRRAA